MSRRSQEDAAWRLIFGGTPKYTQRYEPASLPDAPRNIRLPRENATTNWTSPFAGARAWGNTNKNKAINNNRKRFSTIVVNSNRPITNAQHNRLLNKIKQVTAV